VCGRWAPYVVTAGLVLALGQNQVVIVLGELDQPLGTAGRWTPSDRTSDGPSTGTRG
jgi:hypothetical protein